MAIAVAELLAGLGRLIRKRDYVKIYWVHVAWMILAILAQSNSWWAIWSIRAHEFESYREFMGLVVPSLMFVVIAFLLSPPIDSNRLFDLREYYFRRYGGLLHSSWFSFPVSSSFGPHWAMNNLPR